MEITGYYKHPDNSDLPKDTLVNRLAPLIVDKLRELGCTIEINNYDTLSLNLEPLQEGKIRQIILVSEKPEKGLVRQIDTSDNVLKFKTA